MKTNCVSGPVRLAVVVIGLFAFALFVVALPVLARAELVEFFAIPGPGQVVLIWKTDAQLETVGFIVQRSLDQASGYAAISDFIPAQGDGVSLTTYTYTDTLVTNGVTYYYKLQAINADQSEQTYGPVPAQPNLSTATPTPTRTSTPTSTSTLTSTPTVSRTPTSTATPAQTATRTPTRTITLTPSRTPTVSPTVTRTSTPTGSVTVTPTRSITPTPTRTNTAAPATPTRTRAPTSRPAATSTPVTPVASSTPVPTATPTATTTLTPTSTTTLMPMPEFTLLFPLPTATQIVYPTRFVRATQTATPASSQEETTLSPQASVFGFLVLLLWGLLGIFLFYFVRHANR